MTTVSLNKTPYASIPPELSDKQVSIRNGKCYVKIGGFEIQVEEYDSVYSLMNKYKQAKEAAERKEKKQSLVDYWYNKTFEFSKLFDEAMAAWKAARRTLNDFLALYKVNTVEQLPDGKKKQGKSYDEARIKAGDEKSAYLYATIDAAHNTSSAAFSALG